MILRILFIYLSLTTFCFAEKIQIVELSGDTNLCALHLFKIEPNETYFTAALEGVSAASVSIAKGFITSMAEAITTNPLQLINPVNQTNQFLEAGAEGMLAGLALIESNFSAYHIYRLEAADGRIVDFLYKPYPNSRAQKQTLKKINELEKISKNNSSLKIEKKNQKTTTYAPLIKFAGWVSLFGVPYLAPHAEFPFDSVSLNFFAGIGAGILSKYGLSTLANKVVAPRETKSFVQALIDNSANVQNGHPHVMMTIVSTEHANSYIETFQADSRIVRISSEDYLAEVMTEQISKDNNAETVAKIKQMILTAKNFKISNPESYFQLIQTHGDELLNGLKGVGARLGDIANNLLKK